MAIKKSEAKYTDPFKGETDVIIMLSVQGGVSMASATSLDYDAVHALEKMIVDATFVDDAAECEITDCDYHDACKKRGQTDCQWK
jgi:hypothetical protein